MTFTLPLRRRSVALALSATLVIGTVTAAAASSHAPTSDPVVTARLELTRATARRVKAESRLAGLLRRKATLDAQLGSSTTDAAAVTTQMADARRTARQRAVEAYVNGGAAEQLAAVLNSAGPSDASARTAILANGAETAAAASDQFDQLRQQNDPGLAKLATSLDAVNRDLDSATNDVTQTSALESDAERVLALALAAPPKPAATTTTTTARPVRTKIATSTATATGTAAVVSVAGAAGSGDAWAALRNCESGGAYDIVSGSGRYRGAYQFDQSTWESVGGVGDPAAADPAEQDERARLLYEARGAKAWPHCGMNLP